MEHEFLFKNSFLGLNGVILAPTTFLTSDPSVLAAARYTLATSVKVKDSEDNGGRNRRPTIQAKAKMALLQNTIIRNSQYLPLEVSCHERLSRHCTPQPRPSCTDHPCSSQSTTFMSRHHSALQCRTPFHHVADDGRISNSPTRTIRPPAAWLQRYGRRDRV